MLGLIHYVVSPLSQLNKSWAWLTNTPMPQLSSVFGCVVKAKLVKLLTVMFILNQSIYMYAHMHLLFITQVIPQRDNTDTWYKSFFLA